MSSSYNTPCSKHKLVVNIYSNTERSLAMSTLAVWCRVVRSRDVSAHIGGCNWVCLRPLAYFGHAAWFQQTKDHHKVPQVRWSRVTISRLETQAWSTTDNWLATRGRFPTSTQQRAAYGLLTHAFRRA